METNKLFLSIRKAYNNDPIKWIKAGQSQFCLSDGTSVDKVDENTFKIASTDKILHRAR